MEKKKNSVVDQASILVVAMLLSRVLGLFMRIPLTHFLGDEGNAYFGVAFQVYSFFLVVSSAGLPAAISKLVSERLALEQYHDAHAIFKTALLLSVVIGMVCSLIFMFGASILSSMMGQPMSVYSMRALSPTVFIVGIMAVYRGYFLGMGTTKPTAASQIIEQGFKVVFSVLFVWSLYGRGPQYGAAGGTAGTGVGAIAGLAVVLIIYGLNSGSIKNKLRKSKLSRQESYSKIAVNVMKTAWPIILGTAVFTISGLIDSSMISNRLIASNAFTREEVDVMYGQYNGKFIVLTTLPVVVSAALATAFIPSIAASNAIKDIRAVSAKINLALRMTMLISIPAAIGLSVLGDPIIRLLFPSNPEGGYLLQWGGIAVVFLALSQIATGMLQGLGYVKLPLIGACALAVVKITLNYFLISNPQINILGAVFSTMAGYFVALLLNTMFLVRVTRMKIDFKRILIKPLICAAVMGAGTYVFFEAIMHISGSNALSVILAITFGAAIYFLGMLLIEGIDHSDLKSAPLGDKVVRVLNRLGI